MKEKPIYEFNKASMFKIIAFLIVVTSIGALSVVLAIQDKNISFFFQGLFIGMTMLQIIGVTKYDWPPMFVKIKKGGIREEFENVSNLNFKLIYWDGNFYKAKIQDDEAMEDEAMTTNIMFASFKNGRDSIMNKHQV